MHEPRVISKINSAQTCLHTDALFVQTHQPASPVLRHRIRVYRKNVSQLGKKIITQKILMVNLHFIWRILKISEVFPPHLKGNIRTSFGATNNFRNVFTRY